MWWLIAHLDMRLDGGQVGLTTLCLDSFEFVCSVVDLDVWTQCESHLWNRISWWLAHCLCHLSQSKHVVFVLCCEERVRSSWCRCCIFWYQREIHARQGLSILVCNVALCRSNFQSFSLIIAFLLWIALTLQEWSLFVFVNVTASSKKILRACWSVM